MWASSIAKILYEARVITEEDLDAQLGPPNSTDKIEFSTGQKVQVKPEGTRSRWRKPHIRVPGYIYGAVGEIERVCGVFKDPEALAFNLKTEAVQPLYRVRFPLAQLWPEYQSSSKDTIDVEIYQHWLQTPSEAQTGAAAAAARSEHSHDHSHDHDHGDHSHSHGGGHSHDHGTSEGIIDHGDHQHLPRMEIEQNAVDKEGEPSVPQRFAEALIAACVAKGIVTKDQVRAVVEKADMAGARGEGPKIVAKAWTDPEFKARLIKDASSAVSELGVSASNTTAPTVLTCVENTDKIHNVIVCTLCSCYPRSVLGIPPGLCAFGAQ